MAKKVVEVSEVKREDVTRKVTVTGTRPIMFDRYAGDNQTKLEPEQKLYFHPDHGRVIGMPAINIMSFFSAQNTVSAPKRLRDARKYRAIAQACLSFVSIDPDWIPFTRDGVPIEFGSFVSDRDALSGAYVHRSVARLEKGIPNPKVRPVLPPPWQLCFNLTLLANREIQEQEVYNLLAEGGRAIGFGTFRGVFGKFVVEVE
jgi:hypothetical protein